jgi:hypothetical protein
MTAVMRAVAATGPKVLRIGLVQGGRVLEERVIKDRANVTVGPSEKSMFVLATKNLPSSFKLFELVGNDYVLNFLDGMSGRVALPTGISELQQLKGQARKSSGGAYQVRLTEDARGKVVIGDTTFLFQFVAPPPVQPKPQLPVAVTRGASGIDWRTTIIAAFAFLAHFMAIGAMYSDWLDPVVDEEVSLAGLVDTLDQLPPPPPPEEQPKEEDATETKAADKPKEAPKAASSSAQAEPGGKMTGQQKIALGKELDQLSMSTLGALAASGPATAGVLSRGDVPTGALDAAAASDAGVGMGGGLKLGAGAGGSIKPGQGGGLGSIGSTQGGTTGGSGTATDVKGPQGSATVTSSMAAGSVSNANSVIAGMRAGFRRCYQKALGENPDIEGSVRLMIKVGPGGEVSGVTATPSGNLPASVVSCVQARARSGQFAPPDGGSAVIQVPVTFVKQ